MPLPPLLLPHPREEECIRGGAPPPGLSRRSIIGTAQELAFKAAADRELERYPPTSVGLEEWWWLRPLPPRGWTAARSRCVTCPLMGRVRVKWSPYGGPHLVKVPVDVSVLNVWEMLACWNRYTKCEWKLACKNGSYTDLGSLIIIGNTQCENFRLFYRSDFMSNLCWSFWSPKNCHFDHLSSSEFWIFGNFWHFQVWNFSKNKYSKPSKLLNGSFWGS